MFAQNFVNGCFFGVYAASQCQLLNNVSSSSSSSEFRNAPYAQPFIEIIGSVDFVADRKSLKTNMSYCNNRFKDKFQVSNGKASTTKRKVKKDRSKPLESNTKRDKKSEKIPLKKNVERKRYNI